MVLDVFRSRHHPVGVRGRRGSGAPTRGNFSIWHFLRTACYLALALLQKNENNPDHFRKCYDSFKDAELVSVSASCGGALCSVSLTNAHPPLFQWFCFGILFHLYAGYRRVQLKKRHGILEEDWKSYLLWIFCFTCALSQELRTAELNGVDNGNWPAGSAYVVGGGAGGGGGGGGGGDSNPQWYLPPKEAAKPSSGPAPSRRDLLVAEAAAAPPPPPGAYAPPAVIL